MVNIDSLSSEMASVLYSSDDMPSDALKILHEHNIELAEQETDYFYLEVSRWVGEIVLVKSNIEALPHTSFVTQEDKNRRFEEAQMQINSIIQERLANFFVEVSVEFKISLDELDSGEENYDESDNEIVSEIENISKIHHDDKENKPLISTAPESKVGEKRRRADSPSPSPSMLSFR